MPRAWTIRYAGWIPGHSRDRRKWRQMGVGGRMRYSIMQTAYPGWGRGAFERCEVSPQTMQKLLDMDCLPNPRSWTAYWVETDANLPRERQLWGGAPVQWNKEPVYA